MDVFSFLDLVQIEAPLLQLLFVILLGSLFKFGYNCRVRGGDKLSSNIIPLVYPLDRIHGRSFSVLHLEGRVDDRRILVHKLLSCRAATRLGVLVLVDALEDRSPNVALDVASGRGSVTEPRGDLLQVASIITKSVL